MSYMKRKVRPGRIELDYDNSSLLVNYEVEATVLGDDGEKMKTETAQRQKKIKLTLNENTDVKRLAEQVVSKAKLIHHSKLQQVENLIYELQQHVISTDSRRGGDQDGGRGDRDTYDNYSREDRRYHELRNEGKQQQMQQQQQGPRASLDELDDYMEKLYGSLAEKVEGTGLIVELARDAHNLQVLSSNESLMNTLARVLREDHKISVDLVTNIMYIWFSFSNFSQLHGVLTAGRIGNESMKVISLEIKRYMLRQTELQTKTRIAAIQERGQTVPDELWEELRGEKKSSSKKKHKGGGGKENNDDNVVDHPRINIERERGIMKQFIRKQDKLLFVCFHILLNLAEDVSIEYKMVRRKIAGFLTAGLGRSSAELLILAVTFLKKLSIFQESKDKMMETDIVPRLVRFIPCNNERLMKLTLRLLWNLSFDSTMREQMIKASLIPKLVDLLKHSQFRALGIKLLYHMSMNEEGNSFFSFTEAIPLVMQLIVNWPQRTLAPELGALAVNVSHNSRNAENMCQDGGLKRLLQRSAKNRDSVLMKVVRNISQWTYTKSTLEEEEKGANGGGDNTDGGAGGKSSEGKNDDDDDRRSSRNSRGNRGRDKKGKKERSVWQPFVHDLYTLCKSCADEDEDMFIEVLGTLGNLTKFDLPKRTTFSDIIEKYDMIEFLSRQLLPGSQQDDVVLQIIILVGVFATEREAARVMVGSRLIRTVHDVMRSKKDDNEIVLQTMYSFGHILNHPDTWQMLIFETTVIDDMCQCLISTNMELRSFCDKLLAHVMELCTPRPKKKKKKSKSHKGGRRGRKNKGRNEGKHGSDDSSSDSDSDSSEEEDSDEGDSEEESKYSPSRSMDEMDAVEQHRVRLFNQIRKARFEAHNLEWLKFARGEEKRDDDEDERYGHPRQGQHDSEYDGMYGREEEGGYPGHPSHGMDELNDSGQWMVGSGRHENIAVDMALLGGDDWEGEEDGNGNEGKSYY